MRAELAAALISENGGVNSAPLFVGCCLRFWQEIPDRLEKQSRRLFRF